MPACDACGQNNSSKLKVCPNCGHPLNLGGGASETPKKNQGSYTSHMMWFGLATLTLVFVALYLGSRPSEERQGEIADTFYERTISPEQAYDVIRGCCEGAGGNFSSTHQDCIIGGDWPGNISAYRGCVGYSTYVEFPSGNRERLTPRVR